MGHTDIKITQGYLYGYADLPILPEEYPSAAKAKKGTIKKLSKPLPWEGKEVHTRSALPIKLILFNWLIFFDPVHTCFQFTAIGTHVNNAILNMVPINMFLYEIFNKQIGFHMIIYVYLLIIV